MSLEKQKIKWVIVKLNYEVLFIALLYLSCNLSAQNFDLNFEKIVDKDGALTESEYNSFVYQDSYGYTWISSIEGLNRFDGYTIKNYIESSGMRGKNIQSNFFEDKYNNIWFSTYYGLNYYERSTDCIIHVPVIEDAESYKVFYLDKNKNILWLRINNEIYWIDIENTNNFGSLSQTTNGEVFEIVKNDRGSLVKIVACPWSRSDKGLEIFELNDTLLNDCRNYLSEYSDLIKTINLYDSFWLIVTLNQLLLFDENNPENIDTLKNTIGSSYYDVIKRDNDHLFISTRSDGLWYYNWKEDTIINKWKSNTSTTSLSSNSLGELYLSRDNYLWVSISSEVGVEYASLKSDPFNKLFEQKSINLFETKASSVLEDDNNRIWVSTPKNGVYVFSQTGMPIEDLRIEPSKIDSFTTLQVSRDYEGEIFIITYDGVFHVNQTTGKTILVTDTAKLEFRSMTSIPPNRTLLTTDKGIKELFKNEKGEYYISNCPEFPKPNNLSVAHLFYTNRKIYIPYNDSELWIYESTKNGLKQKIKMDFQEKFYHFFESKKYENVVWGATGNGLVKIENDDSIKYVFNNHSKLNLKSIYSIVEDTQGILWLGTDDGLWSYNPIGSLYSYSKEGKTHQYNPEKKLAFSYGTIDGLPGNSFSFYNGAILSSVGEVYMANENGIIKFNPKHIKQNTILPKIHIDDMTINFEEKCKEVNEHDKLKFQHNENSFSFKVDVIDYHRSEENIIHYRLNKKHNKWPFSNNRYEEWRTIKPSEQFNITGLSPCEYSLELKVEDGNGNFSKVSKKVIKIKQPIYIWLLVIVSIISLFLLYRLLVQKQRAKNAELEVQVVELEQKALRAQMNPHFLLNTLTSIKALLFENKAEEAATFFTKLSNLIDNVLDNSKKQFITLEKELEAIKLYMELEAFRFSNKFSFEILVSENVEESFVRIPPLILQPFVENSILHGFKGKAQGKAKININIFRKDDFVVCEILDNGVGRDEKNFNIKSSSIGIQNTEKRIQLHHPKNRLNIIDLKDEGDKAVGTKVIIELYSPE